MSTQHKLRIKSAAGIMLAELACGGADDRGGGKSPVLALAYSKRVNEPDLIHFQLPGNHEAIPLLENRSQIEVWRRNREHEIDWYCDCRGLYLDKKRAYTDRDIFTAYCPGPLWLLDTRKVAWYASTANRTAFTSDPAETIMKTLVDYNAGPSATTGNGRVRDGTISGISIEADGAGGNTLDWYCAWKGLLGELQDIARVAGGDFDLIKTGAAAWEFRWYAGQRGVDRTATMIFAIGRGNMARPVYRHDRVNEKTVAIVGGQGEQAARAVEIRTGTDYAADNDIELFVDARNRSTTAGLQAVGDAKLANWRAREEFTWNVLQVPSALYGKHYCAGGTMGDLVTAVRLDGVAIAEKIVGVTIVVDESGEKIDIETAIA